jgi:hypothetical protein
MSDSGYTVDDYRRIMKLLDSAYDPILEVPAKNPDTEKVNEICKLLGIEFPVCSLKLEFTMDNPIIKVEVGFYPSICKTSGVK